MKKMAARKKKLTLTQRRNNRRNAADSAARKLRPVEQSYVDALRKMSRSWTSAYLREVQPFIKEHEERRTRTDGLTSITHLGVRVDVAIERHVGALFDKAAAGVKKAASQTQLSLIGIKPSADLSGIIRERRAENIALVKKTHAGFVDKLRDLLENPDNFGMRAETMAKELAEASDVSERHAELVARDQILTLNGQIVEAQQTAAGVEQYVWSTSLDERVRPEHEALEGQTFSWNDPPAVGHPGDDILCRCVAIPVIEELAGIF